MNYNRDMTKAFTVETTGIDINGNTIKRLIFYKRDIEGTMVKYKTARTNEALDHLTNDEIINVWG